MKDYEKKSLVWFVIYIVVLGSVILLTTSCARTGYGCHGRSKIMTRVR